MKEWRDEMKYTPIMRQNPDDQFSVRFKNKVMKQKIEEMKKKSEKIGSYGKYVKEMFQPKVSQKKKAELEQLNQRL